MKSRNNALAASRRSYILTVGGLVLITLSFAFPISAQTGTPEADEPEVSLEDLYLAPGKLLATGVDKQASGPLQVKSYKVEEVTLRRPLTLEGGTQLRVINSVLRLTVTLGSTNQGDHLILLDDEPQTAVITQRNDVSAIFFDASELADGAQISVAVGSGCDRRMLSTLRSTLGMPEPYKQPRRGDADPGHGVKKIRTVSSRLGSRDQDQVEIQLTTPTPFSASNEVIVMQVGSLEVGGGGYAFGDETTLLFRMSAEQFARAENGKRIKVKLGYCSGGGRRFGKLNKAQLDQ